MRADFAHVFISGRIGPMFRQHLTRPGVYLYLPLNRHTCSLQAQIKAADAGEEATHRQHLYPRWLVLWYHVGTRSPAGHAHRTGRSCLSP